MRKHTYTEELAPTNTGSIRRKARFNLRLDCSARARTIKVFSDARKFFPMDCDDNNFAAVWERYFLPLCEHAMWNLHEGKKVDRLVVESLIAPIERPDTKRETFKRLQMTLGI